MQRSRTIVNDLEIFDAIENLFQEGGAESAYSTPVDCLEAPGISKFYGLHLAIWQMREHDLQVLYPLNTSEQRADFLAWCVVHGQHEYKALRELSVFWNELAKPAAIATTQWSRGISRLVMLAIRGRPDLGISQDLATENEQKKALEWFYIQGGNTEIGHPARAIPTWQKSYFVDRKALHETTIAKLIYNFRTDLQSTFDLKTDLGIKGFSQWLLTHAMAETALPLFLKRSIRAWPSAKKNNFSFEFGVNLIGYAYGELGIGEDVRMAAHSLHAAGIPFTIINVSPGSSIRQNDRSVEHWVNVEPRYIFNIICLTALEHLRVYLEQGNTVFSGRYNIGYWPWELHHWPRKWKHCFNLVDEVWASSGHIARAAQKASTLNVSYMPMAVPSRPSLKCKKTLREKYQLPIENTLFVFSFDGNSYIKRKNPLGILEAFTRAFDENTQNVSLVIKCMRPNPKNIEWQTILEHARDDSRIKIIDEIMSKDDVMQLYQCCDCFVSLHRAEGFGRGIAEALALRLEVIATNYGGNIEFCEAAGAHLVPYKLIPMNADDYVEAVGNFWAEPDVLAAACAMREVHRSLENKSEEYPTVPRAEVLDELFSPLAIGSNYKNHLNSLYRQLTLAN
ncbi:MULTISPECIES: glycosyltransferase [unclassified Pseudomonas]|uniref:glycosyltransferase n=1 Tax=unclassified Pseudomonas TaxID=196821 RepID=UPI00257986CF|nr:MULTISPECIES: glycosyltransferase [unclassified Pseudomonas]